jgi:hypothetical protein
MMTRRHLWIIAAAGMVFALIFGVRQSVALFIGPLSSATGLGIAAISLAFACAQLMWASRWSVRPCRRTTGCWRSIFHGIHA